MADIKDKRSWTKFTSLLTFLCSVVAMIHPSNHHFSWFAWLMFDAQIQTLTLKVNDMKGAKRPNLKRVKKSADAMLGAVSDNSKPDFKVNLKTVKKTEEKVRLMV